MKWIVITMIYFVMQETNFSFIVLVWSLLLLFLSQRYRHDKSISFVWQENKMLNH